MSQLDIKKIRWDEFNATHIWERHNITREQVEEACYGESRFIKVEETYNNRLLVLAPRGNNQLLAVVLVPEGNGVYYPVTARPTKRQERNRYTSWRKGGEE